MFNGKVIVITGASAGIGAGTAIEFAKEGAAGILIHGRNEAALQEVKQKCSEVSQGKTKVHICVGCITKQEIREKIVDDTIKEFGRLDVLFNNAGIIHPTQSSACPMQEYDSIFDVNLRSVVALTNLAVPHLIKHQGNIINNSSVLGSIANPQYAAYCMTKAALDHYTRCLSVDLGPKGVRVNCVKPGLIEDTIIFSRLGLFKGDEEQKHFYTDFVKMYPLGGRTGTVEEVANLVLFLASDKAKFMTGVCVPVDGGHTKVASSIA